MPLPLILGAGAVASVGICYGASKLIEMHKKSKAEKRRLQEEERRQQEEKRRLQEEEQRRAEEERRRMEVQEMLDSPWWAIPEGCHIFIDRSVWMAEHSFFRPVEVWLDMLCRFAESKHWAIEVSGADYNWINKETKAADMDIMRRARIARSRMSWMQDACGAKSWFLINCIGSMNLENEESDGLEKMLMCKKGIFFTLDVDRKIRVTELLKKKASSLDCLGKFDCEWCDWLEDYGKEEICEILFPDQDEKDTPND